MRTRGAASIVPYQMPESPIPVHTNFPFQPTGQRLGRSVSLGHAAEMLNVSIRTVYYWIREGRLRTIRTLNGSQRVLVESMPGFGQPNIESREAFSPLSSSEARRSS